MGNFISKNVQKKIEDNWDKLKCSEIGSFIQMLGIIPGNAQKTKNICKSSSFNNMFNTYMEKYNNNFNIITTILETINKQMLSMKKIVDTLRQEMFNSLSKISTKIFMLYASIANIFFIMLKHIKNILNIFKYSLNTGMGLFQIIGSLINIIRGPINKLIRTASQTKKIGSAIKKAFKIKKRKKN